ncbi:MAG: hypothetical protein ACLQIB_02745 [Isosphaeraceae bacterium]
MNEPHDPNETFTASSTRAASLDAGLAAPRRSPCAPEVRGEKSFPDASKAVPARCAVQFQAQLLTELASARPWRGHSLRESA